MALPETACDAELAGPVLDNDDPVDEAVPELPEAVPELLEAVPEPPETVPELPEAVWEPPEADPEPPEDVPEPPDPPLAPGPGGDGPTAAAAPAPLDCLRTASMASLNLASLEIWTESGRTRLSSASSYPTQNRTSKAPEAQEKMTRQCGAMLQVFRHMLQVFRHNSHAAGVPSHDAGVPSHAAGVPSHGTEHLVSKDMSKWGKRSFF